jgi:hypothetical protein
MTMKTLALLLLASIPLVSGRLGNQKEGSGNTNSRKALENETFFATNEVGVNCAHSTNYALRHDGEQLKLTSIRILFTTDCSNVSIRRSSGH